MRLLEESSLSLKRENPLAQSELEETPSFWLKEDSLILLSDLLEIKDLQAQEPVFILVEKEDFFSLNSLKEEEWEKVRDHFFINPLYYWVFLVEEEDLKKAKEEESPFSLFWKEQGVFYSHLTPSLFLMRWYRFWYRLNKESVSVHGTLINVYGVGVLLIGESGVGKSEAAYGLLQRGHSIICDDAVKLTPSSCFPDKLLGFPLEPDLQGFMEVKGVGLVNIVAMHGISVLKDFSRVDLVVELVPDPPKVQQGVYNILSYSIPKVFLEIKGHQDWISLLESVILSNKLKLFFNYDALEECETIQKEIIKRKMGSL